MMQFSPVNENIVSPATTQSSYFNVGLGDSSKLSYGKWSNGNNAFNAPNSYPNYLQQQQQQQQTSQVQNYNMRQAQQRQTQSLSSIYSDIKLQNTHNLSNEKSYDKTYTPFVPNTTTSRTNPHEIESYKMKLQLKDIIISKLESELEKQKDFEKTVSFSDNKDNFEVPKNQEQLYNKLVEKLQLSEKDLEDTKNRLESLITAIALNPKQTSYKNGIYDEQEIAHKIISKMQLLTEENEELSKMLSYGKSKEKDIEIGLLRKQNAELLEKIAKLENKPTDKTQ